MQPSTNSPTGVLFPVGEAAASWHARRPAGRSPVRGRGVVVCGAFGLLAAVLAAGCGGTKTVTISSPGKTVTVSSPVETVTVPADTGTATAPTTSGFGAPKPLVEFGYIKSLTRKGVRFELRVDPAWFLSGVTANTAAAEDGAVEPGQPVPNDNYIVDEGHRLLTYVVPAKAHVTVLTTTGDPAQLGATPITVTQLAQIVNGTSHLKLLEPITTGFWITVSVDTVHALDQQYRA
jgi:hypothetical protein